MSNTRITHATFTWKQSQQLDRAGTMCSLFCAVHCAAAAVFPSLLVAVGISALAGPFVEWGLSILAMVMAGVALVMGFRKHRSNAVVAVFAFGMVGLLGSRMLEASGLSRIGTALGILAAIALVTAHTLNIRLGKGRK